MHRVYVEEVGLSSPLTAEVQFVDREQYPTVGSAQRGNPCSIEVSHSSPSGG